jgi:hypothetical protein
VPEHGIFDSGNAFGEPRLKLPVAQNADDFTTAENDKMADAARKHAALRPVEPFVRTYSFDFPAHDLAETHTNLAFSDVTDDDR